MKRYFTVWNAEKAILYSLAITYVAGVCLAVIIQPFLTISCNESPSDTKYNNPSYVENPCEDDRIPILLYMTVTECVFGRRILMAVILGGLIGWESKL